MDQHVAILVEVRGTLGTWVHATDSDGVWFTVQTEPDGVVPSVTQSLPLLRPISTGHRALCPGPCPPLGGTEVSVAGSAGLGPVVAAVLVVDGAGGVVF